MLTSLAVLFIVVIVCSFANLAQSQTPYSDYQCPASKATVHASCEVQITFENPCTTVQQEMMRRVNGQADGTWTDPHNNGTYTLLSNPNGFPATWEFSRTTGDGKYTDLINYAFSIYNDAGCKVYACSTSQVFSIGDAGTNYCNINDLYCDEDECQPYYKLFYDQLVERCTESDDNICYNRSSKK